MAKIAQAVKKGIQTRKMVYSKKKGHPYHWTYVLRAKDTSKRDKIAKGMELAVKSKKITYSNKAAKNAALFDAVKKLGFVCTKLKKKTTTNCCNLVSVACNYAGIKTPRKNNARTMVTKWKGLGFDVIKYKHGKTKLKRGDILVANQKPKPHTAVYL